MIAVIDYGMGNLRSVQKALEKVGAEAVFISKPAGLKKCEKLVLPGVGAFGDAMKELRRLKLDEAIKETIALGIPFLGLCLGLQLLFEKSAEAPGVKGLCVLKGEVKKFRFTNYKQQITDDGQQTTNNALKVPHMGWNKIVARSPSSVARKILRGVPSGSYMYFVHSYYVEPKDKGVILTTTDYGIKFASGIRKDNIYAFQFHPEKSQGVGLRLLRNFVKLK
ncbi:MAG: imidazole glycerol phosphate synthase subunit HisH [Candidatus Omnitrophota bacterium]|nr:imidazole glycerol phosphate synthase subunit HisH [Candidatus Omnitrophota bacterium]